MNFAKASDQYLADELDGAKKYLHALMDGATLDGREEAKKVEVNQTIAALQSEIEKRDAHRT